MQLPLTFFYYLVCMIIDKGEELETKTPNLVWKLFVLPPIKANLDPLMLVGRHCL